MRCPSICIFLTYLAIADCFVGISLIIPPIANIIYLQHNYNSTLRFIILEWIGRFPTFLSVFLVTLITYNRYVQVLNPLKYKVSRSVKTNRSLALNVDI